jgi:hypothetical protein
MSDKKDIKEIMRKYQVNAESVEDFCNRYYLKRAFTDRGSEYVQAVLETAHKDIEKYGYCLITRHDSVIGETVTYYKD